MVKVAVAGGTGAIGRTIVEAILATKKHDAFVLSRSASDLFAATPEIVVLKIDYSSPDSIASILKENHIDTIISCLAPRTEEESQVQLNLIEGAAMSGTVKRFAPSDFGIDYVQAAEALFPFPGMEFKLAALKKLEETPQLQHTRFMNGTFMDYLSAPSSAIPSNMRLISLFLDVQNNRAVIPGSGDVPVVFTHSSDVGKFVAAALDLVEWPEKSVMIGEKITLNSLVSVVEKIKGAKLEITYDSIEDLQAGKNTELPSNIPRYAFIPKERIDGISQVVGLAIESGLVDLKAKEEEILNELLREVKPMSVEEFLRKTLDA